MIYDAIENLAQYAPLLPGLEKAVAFVSRKDLPQLPDGRVEIDGDRVFANVQTYDTKAIDMRGFEAHRKYADIQIVIGGEGELCGVALPTEEQTIVTPYDEAKDVLFCAPPLCEWFRLTPGFFAIFLPQDAHEPGRQLGEVANVRKCVVKIRLD